MTANADIHQEYSVTIPDIGEVYYDAILDETMTIYALDEQAKLITYMGSQGDDVTTEPIERFLAWLAARRFIRVGKRGDDGTVTIDANTAERLYRDIYARAPSDNWMTMVATVLSERFQMPIVPENSN